MPGCRASTSFSNCARLTALTQSFAGATSPIGVQPPFRVITAWSIPTELGLVSGVALLLVASALAACFWTWVKGGVGLVVCECPAQIRVHEIAIIVIVLCCMKSF